MWRSSRERVEKHFSLEQMGERMESLILEARRLRQVAPRTPTSDDLSYLLARQTAEYIRTVGELKLVEPYKQISYMPPASASTYLYFAFRQLVYPLLKGFREKDWFVRVKANVKSVLVHKNE